MLAKLTAGAHPTVASALQKEAKTLRYQIEQQQRFIEADLKHPLHD